MLNQKKGFPTFPGQHQAAQGMPDPFSMNQGFPEPAFEQGFSPEGYPLQDQGMPMGGGFPGMVGGFPEPTSYLRDSLKFEDYLDTLEHQLRGDTQVYDAVNQREAWQRNPRPIGTQGGPLLNDAGIQVIKSKLSMMLNKFATHANLSDDEIHGYTYEVAMECLMWVMIEGENYQLQDWARQQIVNLIDSNTYFNLSRTLGGAESNRIAGMYQSKDINPGYPVQRPGFLEGLASPFKQR